MKIQDMINRCEVEIVDCKLELQKDPRNSRLKRRQTAARELIRCADGMDLERDVMLIEPLLQEALRFHSDMLTAAGRLITRQSVISKTRKIALSNAIKLLREMIEGKSNVL